MAVAVLAITGGVVVPIGVAFARRIARGGSGAVVEREVQAIHDELDQLRSEVDVLHGRVGQVDEIQGRLDFAERILAQVKERGALPPGGH
jgi:hypothetical protein